MHELLERLLKYDTAIAGAVLAGAFTAYLVWRNNRKSRYAAACEKFRSAVYAALIGLYPIPADWPNDGLAIIDVLKKRFPSLQAAVAEFRHQMPFWRQWQFDRAWIIYRLGNDRQATGSQDYWQYVPHSGEGVFNGKHYSHDNRLSFKQDFKSNVRRILAFAKEA